jgi:molybdopterin biosynthesis enzyme MoaB
MAKSAKKSGRARQQDRARVAGGQDYEVRYEAKKTRKSASAVKKVVKNLRRRTGIGCSGEFVPQAARRLGCEVADLGILRDEPASLARALQKVAGSHDLILTTGGVSTGE